jgi:hypothetical protein
VSHRQYNVRNFLLITPLALRRYPAMSIHTNAGLIEGYYAEGLKKLTFQKRNYPLRLSYFKHFMDLS